jgi:hypothetical protein
MMMKGIIVFNVDVGQASLDTIDRILKLKKEEYKELAAKLAEEKYEMLIITNRTGHNHIDKIDLN